ncbi:unnamed protein product [Dibothriocephalus latus]|uniref:Uncharacterized protein n=1 Tax=Dibothriocephalus latus TaxID=60516 RepID=A0A3P7N4V8_DIBLA|nr:unnamed protein product [Dibothriocephalus latus]
MQYLVDEPLERLGNMGKDERHPDKCRQVQLCNNARFEDIFGGDKGLIRPRTKRTTSGPECWTWSLDELFGVIKRDQVVTFKEPLNAIFQDIQLTIEKEEKSQLAFLDVLVCRNDFTGLTTEAFSEND